MSLNWLLDTLTEIANEPGRNAKIALVKKALAQPNGDIFKRVVTYMVHPYRVYNTTEVPMVPTEGEFDLDAALAYLDYLSSKRGASNEEVNTLAKLVSHDEATNAIFNYIVKKDSRTGVGHKTWAELITELPLHEVMLCDDDLEKFLEHAGGFNNICSSIKKDGVRVWAVVDNGLVKYLSRNGKEYCNFSKFDGVLLRTAAELQENHSFPDPVIFDGEVEASAAGADFQKAMTQIRKLEGADPSIFQFCIFDVVSGLTQKERYELLKSVIPPDSGVVVLEHRFDHGWTCVEDIMKELDVVTDAGEEGLVIKTCDGRYEHKRSRHWCKVKKFSTVDLPVIGVEKGEVGKRFENTLGALICDMNGVVVKVGSGFDWKNGERDEFLKNPPAMIEVRYQEITKDGSLRFPTFVRVREDK